MKKYLFLLVLLVRPFCGFAQKANSTLRLESIDAKGIKTEIKGQCINMGFVKLKNNYGIVVMPLETLKNSKQLKVFLKQESNSDYVVTFSINEINLAKSKKLAGFPFYIIRDKTQNISGVTYPAFAMEEIIKSPFPGINEKDISELKNEMEKQLTK